MDEKERRDKRKKTPKKKVMKMVPRRTVMERVKGRSSGRPEWVPSKKDIEEAEEMAGLGLFISQIAEGLGVSKTTLYTKFEAYPELFDAVKRGQRKAIRDYAKFLKDLAKEGNAAAAIFYMKTHGWKEGQTLEVSGPGGAPIQSEVKGSVEASMTTFIGAARKAIEDEGAKDDDDE